MKFVTINKVILEKKTLKISNINYFVYNFSATSFHGKYTTGIMNMNEETLF